MKILLLASSLLLFSLGLYGQNYQGDSWAKVMSSGTGTLNILYSSEPGLIYKASDGKVKGMCVDILTDFVTFIQQKHNKKVNLNFVFDEPNFVTFMKTVENTNHLLGVSNTSITEERKKTLKFAPAYMKTQVVLLTSQRAPSIKSLHELKTTFAGYTALIIKGSTHQKYIEKIKKEYSPTLTVNYAVSSGDILKNLISNQKSFAILDFTEYIGIIKKKYPIKRQDINLDLFEEVAFIMSLSSDWDKPLKEFLTPEYRASTRYKQIISENVGASFVTLIR